jgi:DNA invertase Pin-like site-specific DNA recombinase
VLSADSDTFGGVTQLLGYARVSTADQAPELQLDELSAAGCVRIWTDHATGTRADRPELAKVLEYMRAGDTLVVWRFDRLARSLSDLITIATQLEQSGVGLRSLREQIDTTTPGGRLVFHVFGALAEFETDLIRERTNAGLAAARARGRRGGRKPVMTLAKTKAARQMHAARQHTVEEIAETLGVSRASVYRALAKPAADTDPLQRAG